MRHRTPIPRPMLLCGCLVAAIAGVVGCTLIHDTVNQVKLIATQGRDAKDLTDSDEDQLGRSVGMLVSNYYEPSDNKKLIEYVNLVGFTLVASSSKPDGDYVFGVLDTDDIQSFSAPNGYIFITRGALQAMHDEAELAGVLAHELTHVIEQHALDSAKVAAVRDHYMDPKKQQIQSADVVRFMDVAVDTAAIGGYDRTQEEDADSGAVRLLIAAGYDPRSYANYLTRLASWPPGSSLAPSAMMKIMTAHPHLDERAAFVHARTATYGAGGATLAERFGAYVDRSAPLR